MMDSRRLNEVSPSKRGWRFVGHVGRCEIKANVPYLVTAAGVTTNHYTQSGMVKRLRILRTYGIAARALEWDEEANCWRRFVIQSKARKEGHHAFSSVRLDSSADRSV